jgi:hypothetical protein
MTYKGQRHHDSPQPTYNSPEQVPLGLATMDSSPSIIKSYTKTEEWDLSFNNNHTAHDHANSIGAEELSKLGRRGNTAIYTAAILLHP